MAWLASRAMVTLDEVAQQALRDAVLDAWLACAPTRLTEAFLGP